MYCCVIVGWRASLVYFPSSSHPNELCSGLLDIHMWQIQQMLGYQAVLHVMVEWEALLVCVVEGANRCYSGKQCQIEV